MEEEHLNIRLIKLRKSLNMNQGEFALHINISQGALSLLENRKTNLSLESLESIIKKTQVNPQWLLSGEGAMFEIRPESKGSISVLKDHLIPLISLEAQAGYLNGHYVQEEYKETLDYFKVPTFLDSKFRMFQVEGESMKHLLYPHDIVITEKHEIHDIEEGQLYIIITTQEMVAKRVYFDRSKNQLILRSENPDFKSYVISKNEIVEAWVIRGKITKHLTGLDRFYGDRISTLEDSMTILQKQMSNLEKSR